MYQYVTEGTFDAYLYQTLENKQKFISQIMTSKSPVRSCDDVDEQALSYAEIKALCAGNPLIKEKMDLDIEVARLKVLKADHQSQQYRMEDKLLKYFPAEIERQTGLIHSCEADIQTVITHPQIEEGFCGMEILGRQYEEKLDAGEMILAACKETKNSEPVTLGSYRGFQMELSYNAFGSQFEITLRAERRSSLRTLVYCDSTISCCLMRKCNSSRSAEVSDDDISLLSDLNVSISFISCRNSSI